MGRFTNKIPKQYKELVDDYRLTTLDYRLPENRYELFSKYYRWRITHKDLDQTHYIQEVTKNYSREKKMWFALCFGMTYRTIQAYTYTETFPNILEISESDLEVWHADNWRRTTYGSDARYNKGFFAKQVKSVKEWLEKVDEILVGSTPEENFELLYRDIIKLYKFGRMTGWLCLQAFHDAVGLDIDPNRVMIKGFTPNSDSSLQSIWNGLVTLLNEPEKTIGKKGNGYKCQPWEVQWAEEKIQEAFTLSEKGTDIHTDSFKKETIWCMFKRFFLADGSKEYPGHSSADHASKYLIYRETWPEIDWEPYRRAMRNLPNHIGVTNFTDWFNAIFQKTGLLIHMDDMFPELPNFYSELGLNRNEFLIKEAYTDSKLEVPIL